jgi:hypothetical protein
MFLDFEACGVYQESSIVASMEINNKKAGRPAKPLVWPNLVEFTIDDIIFASCGGVPTISKVAVQMRVNKAIEAKILEKVGQKSQTKVGKRPNLYRVKP